MKKQYTVTLKVFVKNCSIDLENCDNMAADCSAWSSQGSIGTANMKQTRNEEAARRHDMSKTKAMVPPSNNQLAFLTLTDVSRLGSVCQATPEIIPDWQMTV